MKKEKIFFKSIKAKRQGYFVEYFPPSYNGLFATLQVSFLNNLDLTTVAKKMENEGKIWTKRYNISLMVLSFNKVGDCLNLIENGVRDKNYLIVICKEKSDDIDLYWKDIPEEYFPKNVLDQNYLLSVYGDDIEYTTNDELIKKNNKKYRKIRITNFIFIFWLAIIPILWVIWEFLSPKWFSFIVFTYSIFKATFEAFKKFGFIKKSPREEADQREKSLMQHHHFYCQKNPDGFNKLRSEVIDKEENDRVKEMYDDL